VHITESALVLHFLILRLCQESLLLSRLIPRNRYTFLDNKIFCFEVMLVDVKLLVDGEEKDLNEFVVKILSGTIVGAVTSLRGIKKEWKKIEIKVTR